MLTIFEKSTSSEKYTWKRQAILMVEASGQARVTLQCTEHGPRGGFKNHPFTATPEELALIIERANDPKYKEQATQEASLKRQVTETLVKAQPLPYQVRMNSPFLVKRHEALIRSGFEWKVGEGDLSGGEGWLYYEHSQSSAHLALHTNSGIRVLDEHIGYGQPAWEKLTQLFVIKEG